MNENQALKDQLRTTIDMIPTLVWSARSDGSAESFDQRWREYTGLSLEGARDWGWLSSIHPDDVEVFSQKWRAIIGSGEPGEVEARLRRFDHEFRWFLFRVVPLHDESGAIVRWFGTNTDIEDRRRAEERIRQVENDMRAAIDAIPAIVWTTLPDGNNDFHNERLLTYTGLSPEQLKGEGWTAMFHPADVPGHLHAWSTAVAAGTSFEFESRLRRFDGQFRWFLARAEPLRDETGRVVKWYGTNVDIDDLKKAERALRRSEEYLAKAQRLSHTGSFGWTPSTGEIHWSDESFRIFELDSAIKPTIEFVVERVHPEDRAFVRWATEEVSNGANDFDLTHRLLMPDGSVKYVHVLSHAVRDAAGNLEIVGALMDVTAAKHAEAALRENEQRWQQARAELSHVTRVATLGEMTASITHEVNQPLGAIVAGAEASLRWLSGATPTVEEARICIEQIVRDAHRASDVIRRMRELYKRADPEKARLDINRVINDAILLVRREAISRQVLLQLELAPALPAVRGDRVQLQQVIINLVMNGIEAMVGVTTAPRQLVIRSDRGDADQVIVTVQDRGSGIDPEHANKLFSPFFTTKSNGMGMRLSICRSIIEAHGGQVWASGNIGPGTTLQFTIAAESETVS
jgi:PAS domain S-box-containing protein